MRHAVCCLLVLLALCSTAHGQSLTTGAVQGVVSDSETGIALPGVNVTIANQTAVTEYNGAFKITELIPGTYDVTFEFGTTQKVHTGIVVGANNTTSLYEKLDLGEHVKVHGTPPPLDLDHQQKETRITREEIESQPMGPTFEGALRGVPGAQNDGVGVAMSGSSALENRYLVDGIDITGLTLGDVGTPLLTDFIHEIIAVSGGYNAEYGRSTGGVVNIITRSGTDELRGSVFGVATPGFLTLARVSTPRNASSIDIKGDNAYTGHFGFELGGPIIPKRAWFYVGMAPQLTRTDYTRTTKRQTDCRKRLDNGKLSGCDPSYADSEPDVDPDTGFFITDTLDKEVRSSTSRSAQLIGKINVAVTPDDQAQVSLIAVPSKSENPALLGLPSTGTQASGLTTDSSARWTSKLNGGTTEIEAMAAWHRSTQNSGSIDPTYDNAPLQQLYGADLVKMAALGGESAATAAGCSQGGPNDPYPFITNCPLNVPYAIGGPGSIARDIEERRAARFSVLQRIDLLGKHELKAGVDAEDNLKTKARLYSGGAFIQNFGTQILVNRYAELAPPGAPDPMYDEVCSTPGGGSGTMNGGNTYPCRYVGGLGDPATRVQGKTVNWGAYLQDSWHPVQNVTLNAGMRYEEQRLYFAERLRGRIDGLTGEKLGDTALALRGNWSPRLGVIWDPTREGHAKLYGAWGRYYEGIPMDINDRSFGGEVSLRQTFTAANCGPYDPTLGDRVVNGNSCLTTSMRPDKEELIGANGTLVAPGIKAQYMDETLLGGEIALPENYVVGAVLQSRSLGRVIEDVSTDGANTYLIANPGEFSGEQERALLERIAQTTDKLQRDRLQNQLDLFRGIRVFDRPTRDYRAIELSLSRQFMSGLYLKASYTYSRAFGNYPGLVSYDNGQLDPNISSQYDLIELLANRKGKLPQDRPHYVKIDAHRAFELGSESVLTVGGSIRLLSGIPINALGSHYLYGADESFLLPRGQLGRTSFDHGIDVHVGYKHKLTKVTAAELYVDVFNIYDRQGEFRVDETYAPQYTLAVNGAGGIQQNANPISGGTYEDLIFAKALDSGGKESATPLGRNPNFGRTTARYAPASAQVGFRVTF